MGTKSTKSVTCPSNDTGGRWQPGLLQEGHCQQERSDPCEASPAALHPVLGPQHNMGTLERPAKGHRDDQGTGASLKSGKAARRGAVSQNTVCTERRMTKSCVVYAANHAIGWRNRIQFLFMYLFPFIYCSYELLSMLDRLK